MACDADWWNDRLPRHSARDEHYWPIFALADDQEQYGPATILRLPVLGQAARFDPFLSIQVGGDPRQQAAVADELRRLIIREIIADVAVVGAGGGIVGMMLAVGGVTVAGVVRTRRRRRRGLCTGCGYDLRRSSDRCPECGRMRGKKSSLTPS